MMISKNQSMYIAKQFEQSFTLGERETSASVLASPTAADSFFVLQTAVNALNRHGTHNVSDVVGYGKVGHMLAHYSRQFFSIAVANSLVANDGDEIYEVSPQSPSIDAGLGNDTFLLTGISSGLPPIYLDGGTGSDTLDARNVSAGPNYLFITDASFNDPSGPAGTFHIGDYRVSSVETIRGGFGKNWFLLQNMTAPTTMHGGPQDDQFYTTFAFADVMHGYGGNDTFGVRPGDSAYGGDGDDIFDLYAGAGIGIADGGPGQDRLSLSFGWNVDLETGHANGPISASDYLISGIENVTVYAWQGSSSFVAGDAQNNYFNVNSTFNDASIGVQFYGRGGDDQLEGSIGNDLLDGGDGSDILIGSGGNDILKIDVFDSVISGGDGSDQIVFVGAGAIAGTLSSIEAVELVGGSSLSMTGSQFANGLAKTTAVSGSGSITVNMDAGVNFLSQGFVFTGTGVTLTVNGTSGTDVIKSGAGMHTINAGGGNDQIRGGISGDIVNGGDGNDKIIGFTGADVITGGSGSDQFRYLFQNDSGAGVNADRIADFTIGDDRLNFLLLDADVATAGDQAFSFIGTGAFAATGVGQIRYSNSGTDLLVQADVNGDGVADMEIVLQGLNGGTLTAADFIL